MDTLLALSARADIIDLYQAWWRRDKDDAELSLYARRNIAQFIAEAWSEFRNAPNPRPLARTVGEKILAIYRGRSHG